MMTQKGKMIAPSQKEISKSTEDYDKHRFEVYRNNMLGLDEMLKKKTVDNCRSAKDRR
jgi:hypothetical protein